MTVPGHKPYRSNHAIIRELLLSRPDGLGIVAIARLTGLHRNRVEKALEAMVDARICDWLPSRVPGGWSPVWRVFPIPPNVPKPPPRGKP